MVLRRWIGREPGALAAIIAVVALVAAYLLHHADRYAFLYSGDGSAHLVLGRLFFDSGSSWVEGFGTAWLPFYHVLLALPSLSNQLFFSGAAGLVIGIPSLIGSALVLFLLVLRITESRFAAFCGALLFALNPNVMYLALAPLTEVLFLFLITASAYSFLRWLETERRQWLAWTALGVALATLTRYEAWVLPPLVIGTVLLRRPRGVADQSTPLSRYGLAAVSALGVVMWLTWNWIRYGNPVTFALQIHEAGHPAVRTALAYHVWPVFNVYFSTVMHMFGPLLLVLAGVGLVLLASKGKRDQILPLLFLAFPALFALLSLFLGFAQMDKYWWNSRYAITLALPLWTCAAVGIARLWKSSGGMMAGAVLLIGLFLFPVFQLKSSQVDVVTYRDAVQNFFDRTTLATAVGERLGKEYSGGRIALVTGSVQGQRIILPAKIPLHQYYMPFGYPPDSLRADLSAYRYIVLAKQPPADAGPNGRYWAERRASLYGYYDVLLENSDFLLLKRHQEAEPEKERAVRWNRLP